VRRLLPWRDVQLMRTCGVLVGILGQPPTSRCCVSVVLSSWAEFDIT
jgi:hypothetical protein